MKLLLDEQISGKVADRLRDQGHDVVAVTDEAALRGLGDPDVFEVAQAQGRAVATYNRADFEAIVREYAAAGREHHGLIIIHPLRFPSQGFARLAKAIDRLANVAPGREELCRLASAEALAADRLAGDVLQPGFVALREVSGEAL